MEERKSSQPHKIALAGRQAGTVTGVQDVISFDEKMILLSTDSGKLTIKGEELHVNQLSLEKGEVDISGRVDALIYTNDGRTDGGKKESMLGRLFK